MAITQYLNTFDLPHSTGHKEVGKQPLALELELEQIIQACLNKDGIAPPLPTKKIKAKRVHPKRVPSPATPATPVKKKHVKKNRKKPEATQPSYARKALNLVTNKPAATAQKVLDVTCTTLGGAVGGYFGMLLPAMTGDYDGMLGFGTVGAKQAAEPIQEFASHVPPLTKSTVDFSGDAPDTSYNTARALFGKVQAGYVDYSEKVVELEKVVTEQLNPETHNNYDTKWTIVHSTLQNPRVYTGIASLMTGEPAEALRKVAPQVATTIGGAVVGGGIGYAIPKVVGYSVGKVAGPTAATCAKVATQIGMIAGFASIVYQVCSTGSMDAGVMTDAAASMLTPLVAGFMG